MTNSIQISVEYYNTAKNSEPVSKHSLRISRDEALCIRGKQALCLLVLQIPSLACKEMDLDKLSFSRRSKKHGRFVPLVLDLDFRALTRSIRVKINVRLKLEDASNVDTGRLSLLVDDMSMDLNLKGGFYDTLSLRLPLLVPIVPPNTRQRVIHEGFYCDQCNEKQFIRGIRYKCTSCFRYNLCESCKLNGIQDMEHSNRHYMQIIKRPKLVDDSPDTLLYKARAFDDVIEFLKEHLNASNTGETFKVLGRWLNGDALPRNISQQSHSVEGIQKVIPKQPPGVDFRLKLRNTPSLNHEPCEYMMSSSLAHYSHVCNFLFPAIKVPVSMGTDFAVNGPATRDLQPLDIYFACGVSELKALLMYLKGTRILQLIVSNATNWQVCAPLIFSIKDNRQLYEREIKSFSLLEPGKSLGFNLIDVPRMNDGYTASILVNTTFGRRCLNFTGYNGKANKLLECFKVESQVTLGCTCRVFLKNFESQDWHVDGFKVCFKDDLENLLCASLPCSSFKVEAQSFCARKFTGDVIAPFLCVVSGRINGSPFEFVSLPGTEKDTTVCCGRTNSDEVFTDIETIGDGVNVLVANSQGDVGFPEAERMEIALENRKVLATPTTPYFKNHCVKEDKHDGLNVPQDEDEDSEGFTPRSCVVSIFGDETTLFKLSGILEYMTPEQTSNTRSVMDEATLFPDEQVVALVHQLVLPRIGGEYTTAQSLLHHEDNGVMLEILKMNALVLDQAIEEEYDIISADEGYPESNYETPACIE